MAEFKDKIEFDAFMEERARSAKPGDVAPDSPDSDDKPA